MAGIASVLIPGCSLGAALGDERPDEKRDRCDAFRYQCPKERDGHP